MQLVYVLLLLAAFICFAIEAFVGDRTKLDLVALGLALAIAVPLLVQIQQ